MKNTIGIPRSLFYYFYPHSWKIFFEELGFDVILSDESTKWHLNQGTRITMIDNCLPVKLYFGHISSLLERAEYLFVPRMVSTAKTEYLCPKFIGIPDVVVQTFRVNSDRMISPVINYNNKKSFWSAARAVGHRFDFTTGTILTAYLKAVYNYKRHLALEKKHVKQLTAQSRNTRIGVIGHEYMLKDKLLGRPIIQSIEKLGCTAIPSYLLSWLPNKTAAHMISKPLYWTKNKRLFESTAFMAENQMIDGYIQVNSFPCGPDSFISYLLDRKIAQINQLPSMTLTLDEHTGMAGVNTRIEAFIDLIERRKIGS